MSTCGGWSRRQCGQLPLESSLTFSSDPQANHRFPGPLSPELDVGLGLLVKGRLGPAISLRPLLDHAGQHPFGTQLTAAEQFGASKVISDFRHIAAHAKLLTGVVNPIAIFGNRLELSH